MLRLVANPLGSCAAGGLASLIGAGLEFGAVSPFGDRLKTLCKADIGRAFKEALGIALGTTGEAECSTTPGTTVGTALGTALRAALWTALGTAPGTALGTGLRTVPGVAVGCRLGRGLESGPKAAPGSATEIVLLTVRGRAFDATLVTGLGTAFWAALGTEPGIESGTNFWTTSGRAL